jgi:hypothetical protein
MPAVVRRDERSPARGISGHDGNRSCPFDSKKER